MAYWTWTLSDQDRFGRDPEAVLYVPPALLGKPRFERGDILLLIHRDRVVGAAKAQERPSAKDAIDRVLGTRVFCKVVARVPYAKAMKVAELEHEMAMNLAGDFTPVAEQAGESILERIKALASKTSQAKSWLAPPPERAALEDYPYWIPESLDGVFGADKARAFAYVTVDEIIGDDIGLVVAPWPRVDESGRLRFAPEQSQRLIGGNRIEFSAFIHRERVVMVVTFAGQLEDQTADALRARDLAIGDVFAIPADAIDQSLDDDGQLTDLAALDGVVVYDLSVEARQRAKLAMAAALAPALDVERAKEILGSEPVSESVAEMQAAEPLAIGPDGTVPAADLGREEPS
jgi:hypothetical protein